MASERAGRPRAARGASPRARCEEALRRRGCAADPSQQAALERPQQLGEEWCADRRRRPLLRRLFVRPPPPRGVDLFGPVGRGKTLLMGSLYRCLPLARRRRMHFREFTREVHRELAERRGTPNALEALAARIARHVRLLCLASSRSRTPPLR